MVATFLFDAIQKMGARGIGPRMRALGFRLYRAGLRVGGSDVSFETVLPRAERVRVGESVPQLNRARLIGQGCSITGDVFVDEGASIHFHSLIQAAPNGGKVLVGKNASIQDLVIIKADQGQAVTVGENALVCSGAYLRNCTVKDKAVVGLGAKAYDGSVVEGMLGAGSVLLEGQVVPEGEVWVGSPAAFLRPITEEERDHNQALVYQHSKIADIIIEGMAQPIEEEMLLNRICNHMTESEENILEYKMMDNARNEGIPFATEDFINAKRLMDIEHMHDFQKEVNRPPMTEDYPYNLEEFPRNFNNHKPNYKVQNDLKGKIDTDAEVQKPDYRVLEKNPTENRPDNWTRKY